MAALILKAKARLDTAGPYRDRHCDDFAVLVAMLAASDLHELDLTPGERAALRKMIRVTEENERAMSIAAGVERRLDRLSDFIG